MTSPYYDAHKKELEALAILYELDKRAFIQYRAKCIRELLKWEALKVA